MLRGEGPLSKKFHKIWKHCTPSAFGWKLSALIELFDRDLDLWTERLFASAIHHTYILPIYVISSIILWWGRCLSWKGISSRGDSKLKGVTTNNMSSPRKKTRRKTSAFGLCSGDCPIRKSTKSDLENSLISCHQTSALRSFAFWDKVNRSAWWSSSILPGRGWPSKRRRCSCLLLDAWS